MNAQTAVVPTYKRNRILVDMGGQIALQELIEKLEKLQQQHPHVAGLTMALALAQGEVSKLQVVTTRMILTIAATAGLPLESHSISSDFTGEEIVLTALGEPA